MLLLIVRLVLALVLLTPLVVATPLASSVAPSPPAGGGERNKTGEADGRVGKQTADRHYTCQFQERRLVWAGGYDEREGKRV